MSFVSGSRELHIYQKQDWVDIMVGWETANRYAVFDSSERKLGYVLERSGGVGRFFLRRLFGRRRPFEMEALEADGRPALTLERPFFWIFSTLHVRGPSGESLGTVEQRFSLLRRKYDLLDATGKVFARIETALLSWWDFPIYDETGAQVAIIQKRWGGFLRELVTDADTYRVDFGARSWSECERAVIFAAAILIDFNFFEQNQPTAREGILPRPIGVLPD